MRVGFVIHRYGEGFAGGAEGLAKQVAEQMSTTWDITVLTTCAKNYLSWENEFPVGLSRINGVKVHRFPVEKTRDIEAFSKHSYAIESKAFRITEEEEKRYFEQQGPFAPSLINHLEQVKNEYDIFIFFTYLYYPTVMGLPKVASKSYLVATAHDESPFYFARTYAPLFHSLKGVIFLTDQEKELINRVYPIPPHIRQIKAGYGITIPEDLTSQQKEECLNKFGSLIDTPYFLYLGRASETKRCHELIHAFSMMTDDYVLPCRLLFAGSLDFELPKGRNNIQYLGYVSEVEKSFLLERCIALVNPSSTESLSIVLLEAWAKKKMVIVNGASDVMAGLSNISQGGVYYHSEGMFRGLLAWAYFNHKQASEIGENGFRYVLNNFYWDLIVKRLKDEVI